MLLFVNNCIYFCEETFPQFCILKVDKRKLKMRIREAERADRVIKQIS